jgi:CheY-like chemotaxis protein
MIKLLIVEDEVRALTALRRGMARRGYVVETAETAQEVIEVGRRFQPDILLTDWLLRGDHGGLQVAETLRQINPRLPIVFITALPLPPLRAAAAYLQPCLFLAKPARLGAIDEALHQALDAFRD